MSSIYGPDGLPLVVCVGPDAPHQDRETAFRMVNRHLQRVAAYAMRDGIRMAGGAAEVRKDKDGALVVLATIDGEQTIIGLQREYVAREGDGEAAEQRQVLEAMPVDGPEN